MMAYRSALCLLALASTPAAAQQPRTAILFPSAKYRGVPLELTGPATHLGGMVVRSMKLPTGSSWDLCSGNTFSGCRRFSGSIAGTVVVVRSARPVEAPIPGNVGAPATAAAASADGPSLRGLTSQFYVEPAQHGVRVDAQAGTSGGVTAAATQFCRAHGWRASAYARVQTAAGRTLLADVLCVDEER